MKRSGALIVMRCSELQLNESRLGSVDTPWSRTRNNQATLCSYIGREPRLPRLQGKRHRTSITRRTKSLLDMERRRGGGACSERNMASGMLSPDPWH